MCAELKISDADISYAEEVLLPKGECFDDERRAFIKCMEPADLHAVPGSGKTTALLAKLLIFERHLPFADGSGVLVLSHTNAAVDEIKRSIAHLCPKLFSFPNFIGTIQGFVDTYLAIPYYASKLKKRPWRIDDELYSAKASEFKRRKPGGFTEQETKNARYFLMSGNDISSYRFSPHNDKLQLITSMGGLPLEIKKPKRGQSYTDWTTSEKNKVADWIIKFKEQIMKDGVLCFDDAYFFAFRYIRKHPAILEMLRLRFSHIFVDEMQDMAAHQCELLEKIFGICPTSRYQRVGDRNQAIHSENAFEDSSAWVDRPTTLKLSQSKRLTTENAEVASAFALYNEDGAFRIVGQDRNGMRPVFIVYDDTTYGKVVEKFSAYIRVAMDAGRIPKNGRYYAIGWNTVWAEDTNTDGRLRLADYCPQFCKTTAAKKTDHKALADYLRLPSADSKLFYIIEGRITNILLRVLHLEEVPDPNSPSKFTKNRLHDYLRENAPEYHTKLKLMILQWCIKSASGKIDEVTEEIRAQIPDFLKVFNSSIHNCREFISVPGDADIEDAASLPRNTVNYHGFDINLASVHAVKGQTHTATLYLETAFGKDGKGTKAKSYESQRLADQFLGKNLKEPIGVRIRQSAKMVYVGFSRPTHLLCFAVHRDRYENIKQASGWDVLKITEKVGTSSI